MRTHHNVEILEIYFHTKFCLCHKNFVKVGVLLYDANPPKRQPRRQPLICLFIFWLLYDANPWFFNYFPISCYVNSRKIWVAEKFLIFQTAFLSEIPWNQRLQCTKYIFAVRIWFHEIFFKWKRTYTAVHCEMIVLSDFTKYLPFLWYWKVLLSRFFFFESKLFEFLLSKLHYKLPTFNHSFMRSVGVSLS